MPTQFIIYIPTTLTVDTENLSRDIQQQLSNSLSIYATNFPIHINVQQANDAPKEEIKAPIGTFVIYVQQSDKVNIHVGSQRTSRVQIKDTATIADTLSRIISPVYLGEYESLGNIACHVEKTDKV